MNPISNREKGTIFEKLAKLIIECVFEYDPKFKGAKFTVETNVRDTTLRVPNEIDVLAVSSPNTDYESKFIFECKNWKKPVGKDVIQLLSKKVEAVRATRGFLVAKSITKHAKRQLPIEPRVQFIRCSEDFLSPLCSAELLYTDHEVLPPRLTLKWRTYSSGNTSLQLDPKKISCLLNGKPIDFLSFIGSKIDEIAENARKENAVKCRTEGTHWIESSTEILFPENELTIDGHDVESITVPFYSFLRCQRRQIVSKLELEGHGQAFTFETIDTGDQEKLLDIQIVTHFTKS